LPLTKTRRILVRRVFGFGVSFKIAVLTPLPGVTMPQAEQPARLNRAFTFEKAGYAEHRALNGRFRGAGRYRRAVRAVYEYFSAERRR